VIVPLLVLTGLFTTLRLAFVQVREFRHAIQVILGWYDNPDDAGDINHFQALTTALSATVGIGNIAGVATAIHYGGPGAIFWMWLTGFFGMALKYAECTLSMAYRDFDEKGGAAGGPMYYIEKGLGRNWKPLAVIFALCAIVCSFGSGNMNQANTVAMSASTDFGVSNVISGLVLALFVGAVIIGGIKRIGAVTCRLAPGMMIIYVTGALLIIILNLEKVPGVFASIFTNAFRPEAGFGGAAAGVFMTTLFWGIKRGLFSNEAGQGSAPIAHAAAKTKEPVREGTVAMVGPFVDTLTVCTMTGLVILIAGVWDAKRPDSSAPLKEIKVVATPGGITTDDRIQQCIIEERARIHSGQVEFRDGRIQGEYVVVVQDTPVDDAVLYRDDDPLTDTLEVDRGTILAGGPAEAARIHVEGAMTQNSSDLTAWAFQKGLEPIFPWGRFIVTLSVILFGVSTMISWSYYGDRCVTYLFGVRYVFIYRIVYCCFIFLGANLALRLVWAYGDLALFLMSIPNLIALLLLMPETARLTKDYFSREQIPYKKLLERGDVLPPPGE
jgi:AGCS family alanine or glycine:cation symporter